MASDDAYASFLDKANQSTKPAATSSSSTSKKDASAQAVHAGVSVPKSLMSGLDGVYFVSEADEEFEEVGLKWDGGDSLDNGELSLLFTFFLTIFARCGRGLFRLLGARQDDGENGWVQCYRLATGIGEKPSWKGFFSIRQHKMFILFTILQHRRFTLPPALQDLLYSIAPHHFCPTKSLLKLTFLILH